MNPLLKRFLRAMLLGLLLLAGYGVLLWAFANSGGGWRQP